MGRILKLVQNPSGISGQIRDFMPLLQACMVESDDAVDNLTATPPPPTQTVQYLTRQVASTMHSELGSWVDLHLYPYGTL